MASEPRAPNVLDVAGWTSRSVGSRASGAGMVRACPRNCKSGCWWRWLAVKRLRRQSPRQMALYTPRGRVCDNWRAACVSLPVQKRGTGGLTPLRSPDPFPAARSTARVGRFLSPPIRTWHAAGAAAAIPKTDSSATPSEKSAERKSSHQNWIFKVCSAEQRSVSPRLGVTFRERPSGRVCTLRLMHCTQLMHEHAVQGFFQSLQNVGDQSPVHDAMIVGQRDSRNAVFVQRTKGQTPGMD